MRWEALLDCLCGAPWTLSPANESKLVKIIYFLKTQLFKLSISCPMSIEQMEKYLFKKATVSVITESLCLLSIDTLLSLPQGDWSCTLPRCGQEDGTPSSLPPSQELQYLLGRGDHQHLHPSALCCRNSIPGKHGQESESSFLYSVPTLGQKLHCK